VTRVAVLDYGMGNLRSVEKAFERVGAEVVVTSEVSEASGADGLVLPGVGAFPAAVQRVRELGMDDLIRERVAADLPVLGICLGMQLLFERSDERSGEEGLGLIPGDVMRLSAPGLKLPHIGWEPVHWERESELTEAVPDGASFYFVHSFAPVPSDEDVLGTAEHGNRFACAVARGRLFGLQFHPEKSSAAGLRVLSNFTEICARVAA
jgi:imidazole glycerol-phosphate synthase subunit HisH